LWLSAKQRAFVDGESRDRSPDFSDLETALDYLLHTLALDEPDATIERKRELAFKILEQLPALLIIDDVDSLDDGGDSAIEFFSDASFRTRTRLLMTSRRPLLGLSQHSTTVSGLSGTDADAFIDSRMQAYGIQADRLTAPKRRRIVEATEASPLYLEELLRAISVAGSVDETIASWKRRGGEAAREYALGRELELLGVEAKETLVAASLSGSPVSVDELRRVTGRSTHVIEAAIGELRRLFLVSQPRLIDGVERLALEMNTRRLVHDWARRSLPDATDRFSKSWQAIVRRSKGSARQDPAVTGLVRRATALAESGDLKRAEDVLLTALPGYGHDASLHAHLGILYATWAPIRVTDARHHFERAEDLGPSEPAMYRTWVRLEMAENELRRAANIGDKGSRIFSARF
jgi:hypothetical protein